MGMLEDFLKHSSNSLVISIINVYFEFCKKKPQLLEQVVQKVAPVLVALLCSAPDEEAYVILNCIRAFFEQGQISAFKPFFKLFYVRAYEKAYNMPLKIKLLSQMADSSNLSEILEEIGEYSSEGTGTLAREAVRYYAEFGSRFPEHSLVIFKKLLILLKLNKRELFESIFYGIRVLLPSLSELGDELAHIIELSVEDGLDHQSTLVLLDIFAIAPTKVKKAPYLIESVMEQVMEASNNPEKFPENRAVALALLNCIYIVFIKRPGEMFPILAKFYSFVLDSNSRLGGDVDLRERAIFYYNLLQNNLLAGNELYEPTKKVKEAVPDIADITLNDLSLIFRKKPEQFIKPLEFYLKSI